MNNFYKKIESEYEVKDHSWNLFSDFGDLSKVDRTHIRYKFLSLNNFESDLFKKEIEESKEKIIDYFSRRMQEAKNPRLMAIYDHFLLYLTRNNCYASKAVEYYQEVLSYYLSIHNQGFHTLHFSDILGDIISISTKHKISKNALKNQIDRYLKDSLLSSKLRLFISVQ